MEAEETARRLSEEARRARLEAASAKRHAARTPEAEKAILSAWNRRGILRAAEARHSARTAEMAAKIQKEWDGRRAKIREAVKAATEIRKEYSGIKGLPFPAAVKKAENWAKYTKAAELARKFKAKADAEAAKLDLLENPLETMRKHGIKAAREVQEAVKKKLDSFAGLSADARIKKLEFEIKWVEDKKKYSTWEEAKKAYEKALVSAKFEKAVTDASARIQSLETAAKAAKDRTLSGYVNRLKKAGTPTTRAELDELEKEIAKAEKRAAKLSTERKASKGTNKAWEKSYDTIADAKGPEGMMLIEQVLHDQGFDSLPKLVDEKEFLSNLAADHMLLTRTYGTSKASEKMDYTTRAREALYKKNFFVRCVGGHVHGYGMYFGADTTRGKHARINKDIVKQYKETYSFEEFATLAKDAKIINEDDVIPEYMKSGAKKAPTKRLANFLKRWKKPAPFDGTDLAFADIRDLTDAEFEFLKKGFTIETGNYSEQVIKKHPGLLKFHSDANDVGVMAAKMGYDAIFDNWTNYTVVLNRGKMTILDRQRDKRKTNDIFKDLFGV